MSECVKCGIRQEKTSFNAQYVLCDTCWESISIQLSKIEMKILFWVEKHDKISYNRHRKSEDSMPNLVKYLLRNY